MNVKNRATRMGLMKAYDYIEKDPEQNIPKLMNFLDTVLPDSVLEIQRKAMREVLYDRNNNWYKLFLSLFTDIDAGVRRRIFENFVVNSGVVGLESAEWLLYKNTTATFPGPYSWIRRAPATCTAPAAGPPSTATT